GQQVFAHAAVLATEEAETVRRDGGADGGDGERPGVGAEREVVRLQCGIDVGEDSARFGPDPAGVGIDLSDAVEAGGRDDDAATERARAAHEASAGAVGGYRDPGVVGGAKDGGELFGGRGLDDGERRDGWRVVEEAALRAERVDGESGERGIVS